jgi:hypothetical protein
MSDDITQLSGDPHDLVAGFALDALDPDESARFAAHLPTCGQCRAELAALTETATAYGSSTRIAPPAELEDRLMGSLFGESPDQVTPGASGADVIAIAPRPRWYLPVAAAAAFILGAGLVAGTVRLTTSDSSSQIVAEAQKIAQIAAAPDTHFMPLDLDSGSAKVMVSEEMNGAAIMASDLPMPESGMQYRVWTMMSDGSMVPAATFLPDNDGHASAVLDTEVDGATGFMLTIDSADASHPSDQTLAEVHI